MTSSGVRLTLTADLRQFPKRDGGKLASSGVDMLPHRGATMGTRASITFDGVSISGSALAVGLRQWVADNAAAFMEPQRP